MPKNIYTVQLDGMEYDIEGDREPTEQDVRALVGQKEPTPVETRKPYFSLATDLSGQQETITPMDIVTGTMPMKGVNILSENVKKFGKKAVNPLLEKLSNEPLMKKENLPIPTSVSDIGMRAGTQVTPRQIGDVASDILLDPRTYMVGGMGKGSQKAVSAAEEAMIPITAGQTAKKLSKAQKIVTELLQPSKGELTSYIERGKTMPAIEEATKEITASKTYGELRQKIEKTISNIMKERNTLIKEPRGVGDYTKRLQNYILELEQMGQVTPSELKQMRDVLMREQTWVKNNPIYRTTLQTRKERLQKLTDSLLQKTERGDVIDTQPARNRALNEIRRGIKEAVEAGDERVSQLNSRYGGLLKAKELISGQEALAQKAVPENILQKIVSFITRPGDIPGAVARAAADRQGSLLSKTKMIEKLVR